MTADCCATRPSAAWFATGGDVGSIVTNDEATAPATRRIPSPSPAQALPVDVASTNAAISAAATLAPNRSTTHGVTRRIDNDRLRGHHAAVMNAAPECTRSAQSTQTFNGLPYCEKVQ